MANNKALTFWAGIVLNIAFRIAIAYFLIEVLLFPNDPRFAMKALPVRNLIILGGMSLLFPILWFFKKARPYPVWLDNFYLSLYVFDMAGNSFNLYNTIKYFDLGPHLWGTGVFAYVFAWLVGRKKGIEKSLAAWAGFGIATAGHILLEAQEYYTDVFFGTINVAGGVHDTINDLLVGLLGAAVAVWLYLRLNRNR